jgi:CheY-like chemotaxis protein
MKILIVEDELLIQQSLKILMENMGVEVKTTTHGKEAISLIGQNEFDRIICDLMLQDITGFDVIEESLKKYTRDEIKSKFVIISAYNSPEILEKAQSYGCMFISKPFQHIQDTLKLMIS